MKIIDFEHINEKQKANSIDLSELKDIKIDDNVYFKKDMLKTFDIVKFNNRLYMVFANADVNNLRNCPFEDKVINGVFVRYEESTGTGYMLMKSYNDNLLVINRCFDEFDVKELYVFPGINKNPDGPIDEPIWDLQQLTQERLWSIIKDFKYKHFVR